MNELNVSKCSKTSCFERFRTANTNKAPIPLCNFSQFGTQFFGNNCRRYKCIYKEGHSVLIQEHFRRGLKLNVFQTSAHGKVISLPKTTYALTTWSVCKQYQ